MFGFYTRSDNQQKEIINNINRYQPASDMILYTSLSKDCSNRRYIEFLIYNNYEYYGVKESEEK